MHVTQNPRAALACVAAALLGSACGSAPTVEGARLATPAPQSRTAWVVQGSQMLAGRTVLEGLRSRFPSMQVRSNGMCPDIVIRGRNSIQSSNSPRVYVDGQRASDSCILNMLSAGDVARVEIYPSGHSGRPGYLSDPNGLILVFTRDGRTGGQ